MEPVKYVDEAIADGIAVLDRMFLVAVVVKIVPVDISMLIEIDTSVVDSIVVVVQIENKLTYPLSKEKTNQSASSQLLLLQQPIDQLIQIEINL